MVLYQGVCDGRGLGSKGMQKLFESGKRERKRPLGMEDNKVQLKEIGSEVVGKTNLTQNLCIP
jgi:hypothetical protein